MGLLLFCIKVWVAVAVLGREGGREERTDGVLDHLC